MLHTVRKQGYLSKPRATEKAILLSGLSPSVFRPFLGLVHLWQSTKHGPNAPHIIIEHGQHTQFRKMSTKFNKSIIS